LTSALGRGEWLALSPALLTSNDLPVQIEQEAGWMSELTTLWQTEKFHVPDGNRTPCRPACNLLNSLSCINKKVPRYGRIVFLFQPSQILIVPLTLCFQTPGIFFP